MTKSRLRPVSARREDRLRAAGLWNPRSTFAAVKPAKARRAASTGPQRSTVELVQTRSGGVCEWPGCNQPATDRHHRLNRKQGGRHGEARERVNGPAWLIHACRNHHRQVTSPVGRARELAVQMGWILLEHQDATQIPVMTRHSPLPVWLGNDGRWHEYEEGAA